ncbi:hypothetical protein [Planktotalea frisia]|jgi:hypothetical protein|uniref:hypothetical protein n=1 Tax=Planktotalea frisia TaxID=696762 RepID=UPI0023566AAB|nr:hypothetical protein [Planktotalea frisia]
MTRISLFAALLALAACAQAPQTPQEAPVVDAVVPNSDLIRPKLRPAGLGRVVPKAARTVEEFDVTTAEERQEAAAVPAAAVEAKLGLTVASLGDPTQAGFWIKTPLVKSAGKGRVVYPGSGKSVQVDLIPIEGESSAGSRLSLAAFRIIEAPLTELPEVEVFSGG